MVTFTRYADVVAVLGDSRFQVPPVPAAGTGIDLRWLRATVPRFSNGDLHAVRRADVQAEIDRLNPRALRARAAEMARSVAIEEVPVWVLAAALDIKVPVYHDVEAVARDYLTGAVDDSELADAAVLNLVQVFGGMADERTAGRISLLVQACTATATLIANALTAWRTWSPDCDVPALVTETLRHDPPVPVMRRVAVADARIGATEVPSGVLAILDLKSANRDPAVFTDPDRFDPRRTTSHLTFGVGIRPCPGRDHAVAIAVGVVEAVLAHALQVFRTATPAG
jgi:cytochrome P450